jgi:DNA-binding response OmpR family regulator
MRVLVVEDATRMAELLRRGLVEEGYAVDVVAGGQDAVWMATENPFDAILLDVMLPDLDGFEVCRRIRDAGQWAPVLMLTARDGVDDRVRGLDAGADDYLPKPFAFAELVARVRALGRRSDSPPTPELTRAGIRVDTVRRIATRDGRRLELSPKELAVLELLLAADGAPLSTRELLARAWDEYVDPDGKVVKVTISRLRRKLGDPPVIETVANTGYRVHG